LAGLPGMVREFTTSYLLETPRFNWIRLFAVVGGVLLGCTLALMLVTGYIKSGHIDEALARADAARAADLYAGHVEALDAHERAGAAYSALGPRLDRVVFGWLPPVPGLNVAAKRAENLARTARQAALIELRFEHPGARGS